MSNADVGTCLPEPLPGDAQRHERNRREPQARPPGASPRQRASAGTDIILAVAELEDLPRASLADRWRSIFRGEPPKGVGRGLLIGAIAYAMQARQEGRASARVSRRLERLSTAQSSPGGARANASPKLRPGARLIREWNGSTHTVEVAEDGYLWNGARYRSLSAIARAITGARWSGPRFFGLTQADRR
ncbi:MAG: DUF2924 domain-containing protein [Alphaproteobacteria bacterium]|nr:DUF2924 domain-containing protein [Alphaproteobacteria bacterium]